MCHWQRWPHYAAVVAALLALGLRGRPGASRALVILAGLLILASGAIGLFHAGVEYHWWQGPARCSQALSGGSGEDMLARIMATPLVRCDAAQWTLGGVSLAGFNAIFAGLGGSLVLWLGVEAPMIDPVPPLSPQARAAMLRVDQAGEYGATRIYAGQLAVMGDRGPVAGAIARMATQEERHRRRFDAMIAARGVRPTLLSPFWNVAGFALGAATALIGPRAAMACTAAVETEIDRHYGEQLDHLGESDPELAEAVVDFRAEEVEHRDAALAAGAEQAPGYALLSAAIRLGCRAAIRLSQRI